MLEVRQSDRAHLGRETFMSTKILRSQLLSVLR